MKPVFRCSLLLAGLLLAGTRPCAAHDPGLSSASVVVRGDRFETALRFNPRDLREIFRSAGLPEQWTADAMAERQRSLQDVASTAVALSQDGRRLETERISVGLGDQGDVALFFTHRRISEADLEFDSLWLERLAPGHRQLFTLQSAETGESIQRLLSAQDGRVTAALPKTSVGAPGGSFFQILNFGIRHILAGWDHLLFLAGLLIVCTRLPEALILISLFTVAHSCSVALAALGIVSFSARVVEPLIAASIVFVGLENLFRQQNPPWRRSLTFGFGLVHGLGFAGTLSKIGLGAGGWNLLGMLLGFNLGVEAGQVAVAALLLPVILLLRRQPKFPLYAVPALSCLIALMGAIWLVERVLP